MGSTLVLGKGRSDMAEVLDVVRVPDVRRIELGWGLCFVGTAVSTVAFLVYAYAEGGAALVAVYGVARTLVGAVAMPLITSLGDWLRRDRLLRLVTAASAALTGLAAALAASQSPELVVVCLAGGGAAMAGAFRPLQAASLPWLVRTPAELTTANILATVMENAGALVGPLLAGVVLLVAGSTSAMTAAAVCLAMSTLAMWRLALPEQSRSHGTGSGSPMRDAAAGAVALARVAPPAGLVVLAVAQTIARGALTVLLVVLALDVLSLGEDSVGWLNAAMGVGGLIGAAAATVVLRATRLGRGFVVGIALWGLPLVLVGVAPSPLTAYVALLLIGVGNAVEDASMFTLLPRSVGSRLSGRALGALELVIFAGVGVGSVVAPPLDAGVGTGAALVVLGVLLSGLSLAYALPFARIDRELPAPGPEVDLLRRLPMFAPLPLVVVEQLATTLEPREYAAGDVVLQEGHPGDSFHVISAGAADVTVRGTSRRRLVAGDCFGEIALLRDQPRTATVTATEALHTLVLPRSCFLTAVTGQRVSSASAANLMDERLAGDPD